ncbi:MAG: RHS repeat-associated core domain-containing protein [Phycisphaerales bacterium]
MRKTIQRPDRRQCPSFDREEPLALCPLWPEATVTGAGTHTIRWKYSKDSSGSAGEDCVWVDYVRWSGTMPDAGAWGQIEYVYDPSGRRVEKKVDGTTELKFLYDGDHIIAEYDANDTLLRKYVHGPCIDEPICLIESSGTYAGTNYYHYDALGSVVALTDPNGDVVQLYEYSVYGQVAASDANHPNRFMFTGREFDKDTGLYYYRARYYHPEIGRFLQTDPACQGMNWYAYCGNNAINCFDPSGMIGRFLDSTGEMLLYEADNGEITEFTDLAHWTYWLESEILSDPDNIRSVAGYFMAGGGTGDVNMKLLLTIQTMIALGYDEVKIRACDNAGVTPVSTTSTDPKCWSMEKGTIYYDPAGCEWTAEDQAKYGDEPYWYSNFPVLAMLAHEVEHGYEYANQGLVGYSQDFLATNSASPEATKAEQEAMMAENAMAYAFYTKVPGYRKGEAYETKGPRTFYSLYRRQVDTTGQGIKISMQHSYGVLSMSWEDWSPDYVPEF